MLDNVSIIVSRYWWLGVVPGACDPSYPGYSTDPDTPPRSQLFYSWHVRSGAPKLSL